MVSADARKNNTIQSYTWDEQSPITKIDVRKNRKNTVAYIYTGDDVDLANLHAMRDAIREKGWANSSDIRDGKSVLRVTGLDNADDLVKLVQDGPFKQSAPTQQGSIVEKDKPKPFKERIKEHSLRASALVYTLGNAMYVVGGHARKNKFQMGTGVAFGVGDGIVAVFGGKDDERQFKSLLTKLAHHLEKNGISIPKDSAISSEISTKGEGFGEKAYDFMHEHINKFKALAEVIGGVMYFESGRKDHLPWKQATAVIFTAGFGSSIFIKEKKIDPEKHAHAGRLEKIWDFVQEKPLRVAGWSGLSNTLFTTISATQERSRERGLAGGGTDYYKYDYAAAGTMLVANNLYALGSKSTGGAITSGSLIDDLYGLVAQVLNREPDNKKEAAIKTVVNFLGERTEIPGTRKQIEARLREQMTHEAQGNPWFKARTFHEAGIEEKAPQARGLEAKKEGWANYVTQPETQAAGNTIA